MLGPDVERMILDMKAEVEHREKFKYVSIEILSMQTYIYEWQHRISYIRLSKTHPYYTTYICHEVEGYNLDARMRRGHGRPVWTRNFNKTILEIRREEAKYEYKCSFIIGNKIYKYDHTRLSAIQALDRWHFRRRDGITLSYV
jgi:hypothetical protein